MPVSSVKKLSTLSCPHQLFWASIRKLRVAALTPLCFCALRRTSSCSPPPWTKRSDCGTSPGGSVSAASSTSTLWRPSLFTPEWVELRRLAPSCARAVCGRVPSQTRCNSTGRQILSERLPGRQAQAVEHPRQEGGAVERGGRPDAAHHRRKLLPEREVRRHRHVRRPLHLLRHGGTEPPLVQPPNLLLPPSLLELKTVCVFFFLFSLMSSGWNTTLRSTWGPPGAGTELDARLLELSLYPERIRFDPSVTV